MNNHITEIKHFSFFCSKLPLKSTGTIFSSQGHPVCTLLIDSRIHVEYSKRYNAVHIQRIIDTGYLLFAKNGRSKWRVTYATYNSVKSRTGNGKNKTRNRRGWTWRASKTHRKQPSHFHLNTVPSRVFSARIHENVKHYGTRETTDNRNRVAVSIMRRY